MPWYLAGGLSHERICEALQTGAWGVDISGGVESAPGCKSPELIRQFVDGVRSAEKSMRGADSNGENADISGFFGPYGGQFVAETLVAPLNELSAGWLQFREDADFLQELRRRQLEFIGRPTPLYFANRLSQKYGLRLWLKREDLAHTGAHKINNALYQAMLAQRLGKTRLIAETGAGQHGVATAAAAAHLGLSCTVFMGAVDTQRQQLNVKRMEMLGAKVVPVNLDRPDNECHKS